MLNFEEWKGAGHNTTSSLILFVVVTLAPLLFGSTDPATVAVWCFALGFAVILVSPRQLNPKQVALLSFAAVIAMAYAFVLHEQLSVRPWIGQFHPIWGHASDVLGAKLRPSVSIARDQPFFSLGPPLAAFLALVCGFMIGVDDKRSGQLLKVVAWSGVAYAVYSLAAFVIDPTRVLWRDKQAHLTSLTGPFFNRNTAADYFGTCSILWLLVLCERLRRRLPASEFCWRNLLAYFTLGISRASIVAVSSLFVCLSALFMTVSRAGIVLSLVALVTAFVAFFRRYISGGRGWLILIVVAAILTTALLLTMGAGVSGRLDIEGLFDEGRVETYRATLHLIEDNPWFGTGLGTFAWAFPTYRNDKVSMWGVWGRAHDTLLELTSEMGLPIAFLVVFALGIALAILARGVLVRRRNLSSPVAALSIAILALSHSLVDFSLQTSGYSIVVFALMGAGLAQSSRPSRSKFNLSTADALKNKINSTGHHLKSTELT